MLEIYFHPFSLLFRDRDQDTYSSANCAQLYRGGWWYKNCGAKKPTGLQASTKTNGQQYITWYDSGARGEDTWDSWAEALYELVPN